MAAVGVTSPAAPATVSSLSTRRRVQLHPTRFFAAASLRARCAAAAADGGATASEDLAAAAEGDPDAGTDVAGGAATSTRPPYSIISTANVQKAMRGLLTEVCILEIKPSLRWEDLLIPLSMLAAITDADHYGRLGITKLASTDEVKTAYEKRCEQLNSQGLEEEEISKEHDLLKESFTILSTEEERRLYDWSLSRNGQPERYVWPFEVDPLELAPDPPKEPEDELPTRLVGYFLLAWFIISIACSVILNRS